MYFRVLGPLDVQVNGSLVRLDSARQRTVLTALLASANDLVPLERLIDWCWPRRPPRSAIATIQAHICRLRRALEPDRPAWAPPGVLLRRSPGYLIRIGADELDMLRFELWRGAPLPDLVHAEAAQPMIARLEALRLSALTTRIDADLRLGRELALIPELSALVRRHPYDERLCGQLMVALYRCGRQAESLEAYERMRVTLADDLAIAPSPTSRRLQEAILAQHPDLDRAGLDRVGLDRPATGMVHEGVVHVVVPAE